jgi:predicted small secreted protein
MMEFKQIILPLALFIFIAIVAVIALSLMFKYLNRRLALETVKHVLDKEQIVEPSLIEAIVKEKTDKNLDLRKGIILFSVAGATILFGYILNDMGYTQVNKILQGIAIFPGLLGAAYLSFHFLTNEEQ